MGEIKFATSLVLIALFSIAVISYATYFTIENNSAIKLSDDATMNEVSGILVGDLQQATSDANDSSKGFFSSEVTSANDMTTTGGQFKVGIFSIISTLFALFNVVKVKIFGGNVGLFIFINALAGMLTYIAIRYIYKTWKGGNPD
jgi:hypothetical protein